MTVLGIVGCRIFEDEIVHVLVNDPEIERVYLVENEENRDLLQKLETTGFRPEILPFYEIRDKLKQNHEFSVVIQLQGMGLHVDPARLKSKTYTNVNIMSRLADGILLFYGLCGQAFSRIKKDFPYMGCPIKLLQERSVGEKNGPLEDCVAAALGSNARYREALRMHKDAFFFTPMWAANWRTVFSVGEELMEGFEFTPDHLRELGYRKVARVKTGLSYEPDFEKNIEEFAQYFDFEVMELEGSTEIAMESYSHIRKILSDPLKSPLRA
ncbi:hypothetical protein MSMTP_0899 [Methanosarcina sp. MTP4]|uniref:DUF1638 domain-containing protein n=1 Tax=Methanosarcina sp. MTP4 TaxID=1434100 RepID=UPI000615BF50|nr:DUF1638 domain-containing protein [Methanosarcina sp. MTP4]AKB24368.1 hypothetical protein MSMTP_0899 [Methanosarcina sp. MTP4]